MSELILNPLLASLSKNRLCDLGRLTKPPGASSQVSITNAAFTFEWLVFKNQLRTELASPPYPNSHREARELSQLKWTRGELALEVWTQWAPRFVSHTQAAPEADSGKSPQI